MLQNLSDLEFDLSRSYRVKCDSVIGHPIYVFLLMLNSNIWLLYDIRLRHLSDLEFYLQGHTKSNVIVSLDFPYMLSY